MANPTPKRRRGRSLAQIGTELNAMHERGELPSLPPQAPVIPKTRGPWTARRCHPKCNGWIVANGGTIQRCDACDRFRSDAGAVQHVALANHRLAHAARRALAEMERTPIKGSLSRDLLWSALKLATGEP
jgi:hypothetical protein